MCNSSKAQWQIVTDLMTVLKPFMIVQNFWSPYFSLIGKEKS